MVVTSCSSWVGEAADVAMLLCLSASLSRCSGVVVGLKMAKAVVSAGVGTVVVVTCCTSAARSGGSDVAVVFNKACKSAITFRIPSGKGPDRDSAQYCSIWRSFASTFSTVSSLLSNNSENDVAFSDYTRFCSAAGSASERVDN